MVSFLFWNLNKAAIAHRVARMASWLAVDVLILAECAIDPADMLQALNGTGGSMFCFSPSGSQKLHLFTRFPATAAVEIFCDPTGGLSIRRCLIGPHPGILLAAVHYPSRVNWGVADQTLEATTLAHDIRQTEDRVGHQRTILVGDLNMNPFDVGVAGAMTLHAVMTREVARRGGREVRGRWYPFFYNPMWGHFGDRTVGPPGSYYLHASNPLNYFWNTYDQVLLRPALMDGLLDLRILDSDGQEPLVTSHGSPGGADGSDHLPIFFRVNL